MIRRREFRGSISEMRFDFADTIYRNNWVGEIVYMIHVYEVYDLESWVGML